MLINHSRLATKFFMAGALIVIATIACGAFCGNRFARFSRVIGDALETRQQTLDLAAELGGTLEREDDALLLALTHAEGAERSLKAQRLRTEHTYERLDHVLERPEERALLLSLHAHLREYREAGTELLRIGESGQALRQYHQGANLLLRKAIADCQRIRESMFLSIQNAGARARDEARWATRVVALIVLLALGVSIAAALYLARLMVKPILALTDSMDALRRGEFGRRVRVKNQDELGQLADGFNRMASTLDDFRRSNLGEVLRAKAVLEATLEALPDAILVTEADGRPYAMNRLARKLLLGSDAAPLPDALGRLPLPAQVRSAVADALSGKPPNQNTSLHEAFTVQGAAPRYLLPIAIPQVAAERYGAILVLHDVTEFMRLDELRGEVAALTSHELKTPLTTLRMNLMLLSERTEDLNPRQQELVTTALSGCEELSAIIERLLDVARIEAGQLRLNHERIDLIQLVRQAEARFRERAEEAGISFLINTECHRQPLIADGTRLYVVLSNLLTNALKYTPRDGSISIRCWPGAADAPLHPARVQIAVTDTGPGIPPELRERVFEKFYRIEHHFPERDHGAHGAGLGLYLCRQIIKAHGGSIVAQAGPGSLGTEILITLPQNPTLNDRMPKTLS